MPSHHSTLRDSYQARLASQDLRPDLAQARAMDILQAFADRLQSHHGESKRSRSLWQTPVDAARRYFAYPPATASQAQKYRGLYIYGPVGRGKSMLMDLFIEHVDIAKKRRVHFHQFMLEIHARLNQLRQQNDNEDSDIMSRLVQNLANETSLLCFDEFHVSNIADAMILGRLFSGLFNAGVMVVSTSNWAPDDLYKNGLQRDRFLPFIELIKERMEVLAINGETDYRYEQLRGLPSYFYPLNLETTRKLQGIFLDLTHESPPELITLLVNSRELRISQAAQGIGYFNFNELCQTALGAADYLAIAECLHTVILDGVPILKAEQRNETVRFMTLIDTLYEAKVKFFMASEAPLEKLSVAADLATAFQRTISRLMEMQGEAYRLRQHKG